MAEYEKQHGNHIIRDARFPKGGDGSMEAVTEQHIWLDRKRGKHHADCRSGKDSCGAEEMYTDK